MGRTSDKSESPLLRRTPDFASIPILGLVTELWPRHIIESNGQEWPAPFLPTFKGRKQHELSGNRPCTLASDSNQNCHSSRSKQNVTSMCRWNSSRDLAHLDRLAQANTLPNLNRPHSLPVAHSQIRFGTDALRIVHPFRDRPEVGRQPRCPRATDGPGLPDAQSHGELTHGATAPKATPTLLSLRRTAAGTNPSRQESGRTAAPVLLEVPAQRHRAR